MFQKHEIFFLSPLKSVIELPIEKIRIKLVGEYLASSLIHLGVVFDVELTHSETRRITAFKCTNKFHI